MSVCDHRNLVLLTDMAQRLRCRHCHLTLRADELENGYCPECFEIDGTRRTDFETLQPTAATRYQCEACGVIIDYVARR